MRKVGKKGTGEDKKNDFWRQLWSHNKHNTLLKIDEFENILAQVGNEGREGGRGIRTRSMKQRERTDKRELGMASTSPTETN